MIGTRRQNRGAVVAREVEHRVVAAWFVSIGIRDQRTWVVRHDELGHAAVKAQCARRRFEPVSHRLARRGKGECIAGGTHRGDEDVGPAAVGQCDGGAGVIDEQLLACAVNLPHRALELPGEAPIVVAELGVGVGLAVRVLGPVFLPQQHQRHALAAQLLVEATIVRLDMITRLLGRHQQSPLKRDLVSILHRRPVQARCRGEPHILGDDAFGDAQRASNLLVRKFGVQL
jgi:hypothetical protein